MDTKSLIERAEAGESLSKDERQEAIRRILEENSDRSNRELSELFDVSERTIYADRREIRQDLSKKLLNDYGLAGALWLEYRQARYELEKVKSRAEEADSLNLLRLTVKDRWKLSLEFYDRVSELQIINRIERLEDQINLN